jgi:hypothetical protein
VAHLHCHGSPALLLLTSTVVTHQNYCGSPALLWLTSTVVTRQHCCDSPEVLRLTNITVAHQQHCCDSPALLMSKCTCFSVRSRCCAHSRTESRDARSRRTSTTSPAPSHPDACFLISSAASRARLRSRHARMTLPPAGATDKGRREAMRSGRK